MDRKRIGKTVPKATPTSKRISSNGSSMALAAPGTGGYSINRQQNSGSTGIHPTNIIAHNMTPTGQYGPGGHQLQNTPSFHTNAAYNTPPFVQNQPHANHNNAQNHPTVPNHHVFQNYPMVQNVGYLVSTATPPPAGVPNNTAPRTQQQRQMFGNPHSTPVANQVYVNQAFPSARASVMAKQAHPAQPAQPAAPSMDETVALLKNLLEEDEINFEDHIQGFEDLARFAEAEKRVNMVLTPKLARDFPADKAQQMALARGFFDSLVYRKIRVERVGSKIALNRIKSSKLITFKIVAWKLLVYQSQPLVKVDTS